MSRESWARSASTAWVDSGDRAVVLRLDRSNAGPRALHGTGAAIWKRLQDEPRPLEQIVAELAAEYGVDPVRILPDVRSFLGQLDAAGFAVSEDRPATA